MYRSLYRIFHKPVTFQLDTESRKTIPTVAWECDSGGYQYVIWGVDEYPSLEKMLNKLVHAHEVIRTYSRLPFDIDIPLSLLKSTSLSRDKLIAAVEIVVNRVLMECYSSESYKNVKFVWLQSPHIDKLSLHLIVNGAVFNYAASADNEHSKSDSRLQLRQFYDLFAYYAIRLNAFGSFPVDKLFDRGLETCVQLRILGARKRSNDSVLELVTLDCELHHTLLSHWRVEDRAEFNRHLNLNDFGRKILIPQLPRAIGRLGRLEPKKRSLANAKNGNSKDSKDSKDNDGKVDDNVVLDLRQYVDNDQYEAVEMQDGSLRLNRIVSGYCELCKHEHTRDNAVMFVKNSAAYMYCYRGKSSLLLGKVSNHDKRTRLIKLEEQRQRDVALVMPKPLPMAERITARYVSLLENQRALLVAAPMGSDKSTAGIEWLLREKPKKTIFITVRRTQAISIHAKLVNSGVDAVLYLNNKGGLVGDGVFVVQIESLLLVDDLDGFVVIIDECESVLKQMNSSTMETRRTKVWEALIRLIKKSTNVLMMDAFVSMRSFDFLRLVLGQPPHILENTWQQDRKRAVILKNFDCFCAKVVDMLEKQNKKLFIWLASKKKAEILKGRIASLNKRFVYIKEGMNNTELKALTNVNESWSAVDCVISTPALNVGVSFDVVDHFDYLFMYGSAHSCCVRDAMQATMRVRKFKETTLYFCAYARPKWDTISRPDTVWRIQRELKWKAENIEKLCNDMEIGVMGMEDVHPAILRTTILNTLEDNVSIRYYKQIWDAFLDYLGYDIVEDTTVNELDVVKMVDNVVCAELTFSEIPPLMVTIEALSGIIRANTATAIERAQFDKYCFSFFVDGYDKLVCSRLYDEVWRNKEKRQWLYNLRDEKRGLVASKQQFCDKEQGKLAMCVNDTYTRLMLVVELCKGLGIANTGTTTVVKRSMIEAIVIPNDAESIMGLRPTRSQTKVNELRIKRNIINSILERWSGGSIKSCERIQKRVEDKVVDVSDFCFAPLVDNTWTNIAL